MQTNKQSLPILSTTAVALYRACPRAFRFRYVQGYRPVARPGALAFGSAWHLLLEAWWSGYGRGVRGQTLCASAWEHLEVHADDAIDAFDRAHLQALFVGYHARWEAEMWTVLGVEREFLADVVNPATGRRSQVFGLGGKIDALLEHPITREPYLCEHKTTTNDIGAGGAYWKRLMLDMQISNYYVGGSVLAGRPIAGCMYDVVRKLQIRPLKATPVEVRKYTKEGKLYATQREEDETPEAFGARCSAAIAEDPNKHFARGDIVRLEHEEHEAAADLWAAAQQIHDAKKTNVFPRNVGACERWGRFCEYFDVCTGTDSLANPASFRKSTRAHEELSAEVDKCTLDT